MATIHLNNEIALEYIGHKERRSSHFWSEKDISKAKMRIYSTYFNNKLNRGNNKLKN